jgi:hypothetical protein
MSHPSELFVGLDAAVPMLQAAHDLPGKVSAAVEGLETLGAGTWQKSTQPRATGGGSKVTIRKGSHRRTLETFPEGSPRTKGRITGWAVAVKPNEWPQQSVRVMSFDVRSGDSETKEPVAEMSDGPCEIQSA